MKTNMNKIQEWVDSAKWAASGGNAQPWLIEYDGSNEIIDIVLRIDPEYFPHHSPLDVHGSAAVLSLGCFATNLKYLAALDDFQVLSQQIFPADTYWDGHVLLQFHKEQNTSKQFSKNDILSRHTNRNPFLKKSIPLKIKNDFINIMKKYPLITLKEFTTNKDQVVDEIFPLECIRWQTPTYLQSLLYEINFDSEIQTHQDKIPLSQLGLPFIDQLFFKYLPRLKFLQTLFRKFFYAMVSQKALINFKKHCNSLYFLEAHENSFEHCFTMGEAFQEIWLETNKEHIAFQPFGTPLVALGHWQREPDLGLNEKQMSTIDFVTERMYSKFDINLKMPTLGFRVGYPIKMTQRSPRKNVIAKFVKNLNFKKSPLDKKVGS
jgi:hypothetical protein